MTLAELFHAAGVSASLEAGETPVGTLCADSRVLASGQVFVAMPSAATDAHQYIPQALDRGASAVISARALPALPVPAVTVQGDFEGALWRLAAESYGHPSRTLRVIGITGTNGKTTTAWILRDALEAMGRRAAYLGTLGYRGSGELEALPNTTPFAVDVQAFLSRAKAEGMTDVVMEVSSHALAQHRVDGVEFDAGVFTNLTQDHLDYHQTMEEYREAKLRLFYDLPKASFKPFRGAFNAGELHAAWFPEDALSYAVSDPLPSPAGEGRGGSNLAKVDDLVAVPREVTLSSIEIELHHAGAVATCRNALAGSYNVENTLAAAAALVCLGVPVWEAAAALGAATPVPGRFEAVPNDRALNVLVDYAHTPDAIQRVLEAARPLTSGRLIVLFGCGGDRDRTKRPLMAAAASQFADEVWLTSDNPRTEDPLKIIADARAGLRPKTSVKEVVDRREAIFGAIKGANSGDTVVLAGKGHEDYQIIGREKIPMDDRKIAAEALA